MVDLNSFLSSQEMFSKVQETNIWDILGKLSNFIMKMYHVCTDRGDSNMYTQHTIFIEGQKDIPKVSPFAS